MCRNLTCFIFLAVPPKHTLGCGSVKGDKKFDTDYKFWQISYKKFNMLNLYNKHTFRVLCLKMQPKLLGNKKTQTI